MIWKGSLFVNFVKNEVESHQVNRSAMEQPSEEYRRFLRQFFLIRYTSLLQRIQDKLQIDQDATKTIIDVVTTIHWIDNTLDEVKALPVP
jgi:hypothetical protein